MQKDCRKRYAKCTRCNMLKAKRNKTHAQSRGISSKAPHERWAMDFHGVGTEDQKANVLGAINLDFLHIKLAIMQ